MQLYKLTDEYAAAVRNLESMFEAGDIDQSALSDTMEAMVGDVRDKAVNVALHIKNLRSDLEQLKAVKAEFDAKAKAVEKQLEFYESYLDTNLQKAGLTEVKSDYCQIKYKALPPIVEITGEVPDQYVRIIPEKREPDKVAIKDAIKSGADLGFASLITGRTKLEVK
jgi:uncharacterized protein Yka (UPF0111/DUF47 family)